MRTSRMALGDWFASWPDRIFVYRRKRRKMRRMSLDYATSVLLGLCHKVEIESDVYLQEGRDPRNLVAVYKAVRAEVEALRKGLGA